MRRSSLTREMAEMWTVVCICNTGNILPVNTLLPGRFGFETPEGKPPVVLLNGEVVRDLFVTYDIDDAKRGRYLD